ncbi:Gfo/Idh/MocA family oxidoreductase [Acidobacteria bacterium AH-259-A15]|nr:Gfo/Idh/MocA family oxidoreductase [Acidobacteria bacterium AH-259-A15]
MTKKKSMGRRDFFKSSVAATGSLLLARPETAFSTSANSSLRLGILGCGGRGNNVAGVFVEHTNTQVTALADLFDDRLEHTRRHFDNLQKKKGRSKIGKTFKGGKAYLELLQSDIDVVLITTPPYFHPQHLEAALDAGKHVYLEKPVATDVRGCRKVADLSAKAEEKVSVDVGFQIRSGPHFVELTRRLQEGAVGEIACAQGFYFAGDLPRKAKPGMSKLEARIRDWAFDRVLSGDVLVEQNIHIVDVFNWVLKAHPLRATATAGRKIRTDIGDVSDHFVVTYDYPNDIRIGFMSTQFLPSWGKVCMRFFGSKGYSEAFYSGGLRIQSENPWEAGADQAPPGTKPEIDPLKDATPEKAKAYVKSIRSGHFHNQLRTGAESSLSAILGRQAAYEGRELSWGELLASNQHWDAGLDLNQL